MFLTPDELVELTGYKRKSRQITWLQQARLRHFVAAGGTPRVLRTELEQPMSGRTPRREHIPRLELINKDG